MFELSLIFILTFLTFLNAYKGKIVHLIINFLPENPRIKSTTAKIITLEKELGTISMINEFAKHFKLQRRILKLKEEKSELVKIHALKSVKIRFFLTTTAYFILLGILGSLMWLYRSEPVVKVPAHWLWPVSSFFDWCNYVPGYITVPCWVAISTSATATFAKHF